MTGTQHHMEMLQMYMLHNCNAKVGAPGVKAINSLHGKTYKIFPNAKSEYWSLTDK